MINTRIVKPLITASIVTLGTLFISNTIVGAVEPPTAKSLVEDGATSVQIQTVNNGAAADELYGVQDLSLQPIQNQSAFRAGSVTKPMIATVAMQLVDEKKIDLDAPISTYIPGKLTSGDKITMREVLSHRSGLSNAYETSIPLNNTASYPTTYAKLTEMFEAGFNTDQLLRYIDAQPLASTPGTQFSYSNANYVVAGAVIQAVTGESYEQNVSERILRPLGMNHSYLSGTDVNMPSNAAHAYEDISAIVTDKKGAYDVTRYNASQANAAGELISTTEDLNIFSKALVSGKLMSPRSFSEMTDAKDTGSGYSYGLGIIKLQTRCGTVYGHNGAIYGYATEMYITADGSKQVALSSAEGPRLPYTTLTSLTGSVAINKLCMLK